MDKVIKALKKIYWECGIMNVLEELDDIGSVIIADRQLKLIDFSFERDVYGQSEDTYIIQVDGEMLMLKTKDDFEHGRSFNIYEAVITKRIEYIEGKEL